MLKKLFFWSILLIFVAAVIVRLALPTIVKAGITSFFEKQSIATHIADVSFNLLNGHVLITGIRGNRQGADLFSVSSLSLQVNPPSLFYNKIAIEHFAIDGLNVGIEKQPDGSFIVAGIDLAGLQNNSTTETDRRQEPAADWVAVLDKIKLSNFNFCYRDKNQQEFDYCTSFAELSWQGHFYFDLAKLSDSHIPLYTLGDIELVKLDAYNNYLGRSFIQLDSLSVKKLDFETLKKLRIDQITFSELNVMQRTQDEQPAHINHLQQFSITDLLLEQLSQLHIKQVDILGHQVLIQKNNDSSFEFEDWVVTTVSSTTTTEPDSEQQTFSYQIDVVNYETDNTIRYLDNSLKERFHVELGDTTLHVGNINSSKPEQPSKLHYQSRYDEHGVIKFDGTATPLADKPGFDIDGKLEGLDLRGLSALTSNSIGHTIKSGQLDATLTLKAEQSVLDSNIGLTLHQFELKASSKEDANKLDAEFGLPLNTSLSLLRDRDNSIQLSIPITGNLQNPDFDPNDAIKKATSKAITAAVLNYYTPIGLVIAADSLFSLATALRFEPIEFESGSAQLSDTAITELGKLTQLLNERPGVRLTLCGLSNTADRVHLHSDTANQTADNLNLSAEQKHSLEELAEKRAATIKQLMIEQGTDASRLILCAPEHIESNDAISGVTISI